MTSGLLVQTYHLINLEIWWVTQYLVGYVFLPSIYATKTKNHLSNWSFAPKLIIHAFFLWNSNKLMPHSGNDPKLPGLSAQSYQLLNLESW